MGSGPTEPVRKGVLTLETEYWIRVLQLEVEYVIGCLRTERIETRYLTDSVKR